MRNEADEILHIVESHKKRLNSINKDIYTELLQALNIYISNGKFDGNTRDIARLSNIISDAFKKSGYYKNAKTIEKDLIKLIDISKQFYVDDKSITFKNLNLSNVLLKRSLDNVMFDLVGEGFKVNVEREIENKLFQDIVLRRDADVVLKELKDLTTGESNIITKQNNEPLENNIFRFSGTANNIIGQENNLRNFLWIGSIVELSRPMCTHIRKDYPNGLSGKEMQDILDEYIPDGIPSSEVIYLETENDKVRKLKKGSGLKKDTDIENIIINRGGWNCRHVVKWVRFIRN